MLLGTFIKVSRSLSRYDIIAVVDADDSVEESDETNNMAETDID